ncbi:MAG TPA: hypothetical protein VF669_08675 [Tepidisphaeraceae bacterium]|jgi:hypothetical protein
MASGDPTQKSRLRAQLDVKVERWSAYVVAVVFSLMIIGASARVAIRPAAATAWKILTAGWLLEIFAVWNAMRLRREHVRSKTQATSGQAEDAI